MWWTRRFKRGGRLSTRACVHARTARTARPSGAAPSASLRNPSRIGGRSTSFSSLEKSSDVHLNNGASKQGGSIVNVSKKLAKIAS